MDLDRIAQAFAAGFTVGRAMAMDAAKGKDDEDGHWVTVGAETGPDGEKHGGRPVFIHGSDTYRGAGAKKKRAETKKEIKQRANAKKSNPVDSNDMSMERYMARTKFRSGTFADAWLSNVPNGAKAFASLTENMTEDCQYLLKNVLTTVKYKQTVGPFKPNESEAFYSGSAKTVNFPDPYFKNAISRNKYKSTWETVIHELGHAVDNIAEAEASDSAGTPKAKNKWITKNARLKSAVESDTKALITKLKNDIQQKFKDDVREKDLMLKRYRSRNPKIGTPTAEELINFGIAETIRGWQNSAEGGWCGIISGTSDMLSAVTLNKIKDGGSHPTEYWMGRQFNITREFMAHYFEACTNEGYKKAFAQVFPTATKVLEILIEKTANTIKQKETKK